VYLAALRSGAGMTQQQAAAALNVSQSAVTMWETGKTKPRAGKIPNIAKAYGVTVECILSALDKDRKGEDT